MAYVPPRKPTREQPGQRVVARSKTLDRLEAVLHEDLGETLRGEDARMEPGGLELVGRRLRECEGIADRPARRDVRQREGHEAENECRHVVPAGEVLSADQSSPAGAEDAVDLADEVVQRDDVLDDLVRMHEVEGLVLERQRVVEVPGVRLDAVRLRRPPSALDNLYAGNSFWPARGLGQSYRERAVVATEVEQ